MISVITVNYKTIDYAQQMLRSLFAHHGDGIEVFLVENNSGDDLAKLREEFPQVNVIEAKKNLGFAGGCNRAIAQADGDYIALINPDVIFDDSALPMAGRILQELPDVGVAGVSLQNLDGTQQQCVWGFPKPMDQLLLLLKLHHLFPNLPWIRRWLALDFDYTQSQDVDQVMGAFFIIRRELINRIGMLDDGFFMWYEEVDYCKRAVDAGWRVRYIADIHARHRGGASFDRVRTMKKQAMLRRSVRRYMWKHYGPIVGTIFTLGEPVFWLASCITSLLKPI